MYFTKKDVYETADKLRGGCACAHVHGEREKDRERKKSLKQWKKQKTSGMFLKYIIGYFLKSTSIVQMLS